MPSTGTFLATASRNHAAALSLQSSRSVTIAAEPVITAAATESDDGKVSPARTLITRRDSGAMPSPLQIHCSKSPHSGGMLLTVLPVLTISTGFICVTIAGIHDS